MTIRLGCTLVAWVCVLEWKGHPMEDQFRDPEVEHVAVMENLGMVGLHVFAWGRWQRVSAAKT